MQLRSDADIAKGLAERKQRIACNTLLKDLVQKVFEPLVKGQGAGLVSAVVDAPEVKATPDAAANLAAAPGILADAHGVIASRAAEYDRGKDEERSFPEIARRFNQRTGLNMNARQAVVFLQVLKQVRRDKAPGLHRDSFVDEACYIALEAEYAAQGMPVHTQQDKQEKPC